MMKNAAAIATLCMKHMLPLPPFLSSRSYPWEACNALSLLLGFYPGAWTGLPIIGANEIAGHSPEGTLALPARVSMQLRIPPLDAFV